MKVMREGRKGKIYDSCPMYSPGGELLCYIGVKRVKWYLKKDLAEIEGSGIRLKFDPNGMGHIGDDFYMTPRVNVCAVCGSEKELTIHHIVPYCYRRHFPEDIKNHSCHDLVPLCHTCHDGYEPEAMKLKKLIAEEYGIVSETRMDRRVAKAAHALLRHARKECEIPESKRLDLALRITEYFGVTEISEELIMEAAGLFSRAFDSSWKEVAGKIGDLQGFIERWRNHFMETMKPGYMPTNWSIERRD